MIRLAIVHACIVSQISAGDENLRRHFQECRKSATYRSKTIQNEVLQVVGDMTLDKVVSEAKKSKFFSSGSDDSLDKSDKEQMTVGIRYVDSNSK